MNWDATGAVTEQLLGSLLVMATLLYVAVQNRSVNKQSQAEARDAFIDAVAQFVRTELEAADRPCDMVRMASALPADATLTSAAVNTRY